MNTTNPVLENFYSLLRFLTGVLADIARQRR
nr:MAG TPA: hypothetical protein [Caudoviricetes sp.]